MGSSPLMLRLDARETSIPSSFGAAVVKTKPPGIAPRGFRFELASATSAESIVFDYCGVQPLIVTLCVRRTGVALECDHTSASDVDGLTQFGSSA